MIMPTLDESHHRSVEGFGISYLEAAFFEIPSVASNVGGAPEAVLHEKTGIILEKHEDLFDVLKKLLSNKEKIKKLGENAKNRAIAEFTWTIISKKYISLVND